MHDLWQGDTWEESSTQAAEAGLHLHSMHCIRKRLSPRPAAENKIQDVKSTLQVLHLWFAYIADTCGASLWQVFSSLLNIIILLHSSNCPCWLTKGEIFNLVDKVFIWHKGSIPKKIWKFLMAFAMKGENFGNTSLNSFAKEHWLKHNKLHQALGTKCTKSLWRKLRKISTSLLIGFLQALRR